MHWDYMVNELHQMFALLVAAVVFLGPPALLWYLLSLVAKKRKKHYIPPQNWGHGYVSHGEYSRSAFGVPWKDVDFNGRDTRNDILARDLINPTFKANRNVQSGTLYCPYTGQQITFFAGMRNAVEIDHIVPLSLAWNAGARYWSLEQREQFANDPMNLLAVAASANRAKGNSGPAAWLPSNIDFQHEYLRRFDAVARRYGLVLSPEDRAVLDSTLAYQGSETEHLRMSGLVP